MSNLSIVLKNSLVYTMIGFLPLGSNILLTPIYAQYLEPKQYGLIALASIFQTLLTILIGAGMDGALSRYYFKYYKNRKITQALFSSVLILITVLATIFSVFFYLYGTEFLTMIFKSDLFTYEAYGRYVFVGTFFNVIHSLFLIYYRNEENVGAFIWVSTGYFLAITFGAFYGVVVLEEGAFGSIAGKMWGAIISTSIILLIYFIKNPFRIVLRFYPKLFEFALPIIPYLLLGLLFDNIDRFIIERYFSLDTLGEYNFAFMIATVLAVLINSIASTVNPRVYKIMENPASAAKGEINSLFIFFHMSIILFILIGQSLVAPVVYWLINPAYHPVIMYLPILFLSYIPRVYYCIYSIPIFFQLKTRVMPLINFISLVAGVLTNYLLVPIMGIYGVCIGVVTIKLVQFLLALYYSRKYEQDFWSEFKLSKNHIVSVLVIVLVTISVLLAWKFNEHNQVIWIYLLPMILTFPVILVLFKGSLLKTSSLIINWRK